MASLCIVGEDEGAVALASRLLSSFKDLMTTPDAAPTPLTDLTRAETLSLETKYYRASIAIRYEAEEITSETGALVHVLTVARANEVMAIEGSDSRPRPTGGEAGSNVPVRLLVVIKDRGQAMLTEGARLGCMTWSLEHGFEFIDVDMEDLASTHLEREKDGLPRIIEALEANMWVSMEKKGASAAAALPPAVPAASPDGEAAPSTLPPAPAVNDDDLDLDSEGLLPAKGGDAQDEEEALLDKFSDLVSHARQCRESAVAGQLSDAERRDKAAAFALQFSAMLDEADDEDD